ncbi:putative phage abortive infection protein [Erwinia sp. AnSW2-5]|uniref:putative phage abortive infection protein n=1 Tax=Erwinia sp. AnSW2-5 TaxID=3367692 RepID=UPI00385D6962
MALIWFSRKLGVWLDKVFGGWLNDGVTRRVRKSKIIDLKKDVGVVNKILIHLFSLPSYRRFMQRHFIQWLNPEKLTPVTKRYLFLYSVSVFFILSIEVIIISICLWLSFTDKDGALVKANVLNTLTAIGTMGAAYYAGRSAKAMLASNNNSEENRETESLDRRFSMLLEQHNNYLNMINTELRKPEMAIFSPKHMKEMSLGQGLSIIRGENTDIVVNECTRLVGTQDNKSSQEVIDACNSFAKNTLSPYMRILYHTLKTIKEGCGDNDYSASVKEKQYTNIIRSIIPNDVLFLVALNSVAIYRDDRSSLCFAEKIDVRVYNDYAKYFFLLRRYAFFEHLNIIQSTQVLEREYNFHEFNDTVLSQFKNVSGRIYSIETTDGKKAFVLKDDGIDSFSDLMRYFAMAVKKENLMTVICSFYEIDRRNKSRKILQAKFLHALNYVASMQSEEVTDRQLDKKHRMKELFLFGAKVDYEEKVVYLNTTSWLRYQIFGDMPIT